MADILAGLESIIGKEAADKIRASETGLATMTRVNDVMSFYDGESETPPPPPRHEPPPASGVPAPQGDSLAAIMAKLDGIGDIDKKIADGVKSFAETHGSELRGAAVADSIKITRELTRLDSRHRTDFGEELDDDKLRAHIDAAKETGRPFRTVTDAYEDMTRAARNEKSITAEVDKRDDLRRRAAASGALPGQTPTAATPMLQMLKTSRRGTTGNGDAGNHLDKAGQALAERLAANGQFIPA